MTYEVKMWSGQDEDQAKKTTNKKQTKNNKKQIGKS